MCSRHEEICLIKSLMNEEGKCFMWGPVLLVFVFQVTKKGEHLIWRSSRKLSFGGF